MSTDYKTWCRFCGGLDGIDTKIDERVTKLMEFMFKSSSQSSTRVCQKCITDIDSIISFLQQAEEMDKMFKGLDEDDKNDLSLMRLNAYRKYFKLPPISDEILITSMEEDEMIVEEEQELEQQHIEDEYNHETVIEEFIIENHSEVDELDDSDRVIKVETKDLKLFNFQCHLCNRQAFENMSLLTRHCKVEHNASPSVKCCSDECGKMLMTWRRLLIHKERHFPSDEVLKCNICFTVLNTKVGYDKHMKSHEYPFICSFCGKSFNNKKTLVFHESTHKAPVNDRKQFECNHCFRRFITKQTCQNHIAQKHERTIQATCPVANCGKSFYTRKAMQEHQRSHRGKIFECPQCDFKTKTKSNLYSHMDIHESEKNFDCDMCDAKFNSKKKLKSHLIIHSEDFPYECTKCDKKFRRQQGLQNHEVNHEIEDQPLDCNFCDKNFTKHLNLRKHKLIFHHEDVVKLELQKIKKF